MALVVRANKRFAGLGRPNLHLRLGRHALSGGFHHFFRGRGENGFDGDMIYFQGHASPGIYAHAFLEGRLTLEQMDAFRRESAPGGGLASYPHPWLMPGFWEFPTVSMGLGPIAAIYQAKFNRYLRNRGLRDVPEPQGLGPSSATARRTSRSARRHHARLPREAGQPDLRHQLQLQRLDGPVRGNGKIIQELRRPSAAPAGMSSRSSGEAIGTL